jgi:MarR family transcriptional regulator, lower aerobic nicotinate degradation pathway regulator
MDRTGEEGREPASLTNRRAGPNHMYTYDLMRMGRSGRRRWKGPDMKSSAAKLATAAAKDDAIDSYALEQQVGHLLRRAHQRHTTIFQEGMGDLQLTPTQFAALAKIRDVGPISQNQLGRLTAMDPATIQGVVQRLAARGLVDRTPDQDDRRLMLLRLSAKGRALVQTAIARGIAISESTLTPLSEAERPVFLSLLRKLI